MKPTSQYLKTALLSLIVILGITLSASAQIQKGQDIDGEAELDRSGYSVSMPDANTIAIGAPEIDVNGDRAGQVRIYTWIESEWNQKGQDIDGEKGNDISGHAISMPDANTVAIGAPRNSGNGTDAGHVRVYRWNNSEWVQKGQDIDGEAEGDWNGYFVSMPDANTVAIGAPQNNGNGANAGHVRVYSWSGSEWVQKGLDLDGEAASDLSGRSVSMPDANTLAIGAPWNDGNGNNSGHVRVYHWNVSAWVQKGQDIDGETSGNFSGTSVSMPDANTLAIGSPGNNGNGNDAGHVRIFTWDGNAWLQKGQDIDGEAAGDNSGRSVSMPDANTVAIGAPINSENGSWSGHVRVYTWNGNSWTQLEQDIDGEVASDQFGHSVSMPDANTVAVGAPFNSGIGSWAGHVRVFTLKPVGIIDNSFSDKFSIYPNPTTGQLFIHFDAIQDELNVSLYTLDGKLIESSLTKNASNYSYEIKAPAGIYLLKISNKDHEATVRVVKE